MAGSKLQIQEFLPVASSTSDVMYAVEVAVPFAESGTFLLEHLRPCLT